MFSTFKNHVYPEFTAHGKSSLKKNNLILKSFSKKKCVQFIGSIYDTLLRPLNCNILSCEIEFWLDVCVWKCFVWLRNRELLFFLFVLFTRTHYFYAYTKSTTKNNDFNNNNSNLANSGSNKPLKIQIKFAFYSLEAQF